MYRSEINALKKCVKLVINTNCTEMHGQQNIKLIVNFKKINIFRYKNSTAYSAKIYLYCIIRVTNYLTV